MKLKVTIFALVALVIAVFVFKSSGPKNYDECIEQNIEKAKTRESALIVNQMCKKRFPKTFTDEEVFGR